MLEEIASSEQCNVGGILLDDDTKEVRVVSYNYARTERTFFDKVPDRVRNLTCRRL